MIFIDNKYTRWYYDIVNRAQSRNLIKGQNHHIIPESFYKQRVRKGPSGWLDGDPEKSTNKVILTSREHVICHLLLARMTSGLARSKMANAAFLMTTIKDEDGSKYKINSKTYAVLVEENNKILQDGEIQRKSAYNRISLGIHNFIGLNEKRMQEGTHNFTGETSPSQVKWCCMICKKEGKGLGNFTKLHGDNCNTTITLPASKCPHCGKIGAGGAMKRWHGDKCKSFKIA